IGAGTAAAIAAAALAATLISNQQPTTPPPDKPPAAQPPAPPEAPTEEPPAETPPAQPSDEPPVVTEEPPAAPTSAPAPTPTPTPSKSKQPLPTPSHPLPDPLVITPGRNGTAFAAGTSSVLPITIENNSTGGGGGGYETQDPDQTMTLSVRLPEGFRFTGTPAGDGWSCVRVDAGLECGRAAIRPGESTTAELRIHVDKYVSGRREITAYVAIEELTASRTYQVTVRPKQAYESKRAGYRTAYHRRDSLPE
ncbi:MAG: hypothetical protein ACRDT4_26435, partial [Micromonosporaceae bacterium]